MFKKSILALAVLSTTASVAYATEVTLYGRIDEGLVYTNTKADFGSNDSSNAFELSSGNYTGSRWGFKGSEDLGNGLKVGFVLESGFSADTGSMSSDGLFNREATVHLKGGFGELGFGRSATLELDSGSYGIGDRFSVMGTGVGDMGNQQDLWGAGIASRYSNMITYVTPEFYGAKVYVQYSFGDGSTGDEGKSSTNRYAGLGATYDNGPLSLAFIVDMVNNASNEYKKELEDTYRVIFGGSYNLGVVKPYFAASYFKDGKITDVAGVHSAGPDLTVDTYGEEETYGYLDGYYDGWSIMLGAGIPLLGGDLSVEAGYMEADLQGFAYAKDVDANGYDLKRWLVAANYTYPLSKKTKLYGFTGYVYDSVDSEDKDLDRSPTVFQFGAGIVHYF